MFLVERYWPGVTMEDVRQAAERTVTAASVGWGPTAVRYLGSVLVENEETVFSLFDGPDVTVVAEANRAGEFRYDRICAVVTHVAGQAAPRSASVATMAAAERGSTLIGEKRARRAGEDRKSA